MVSKDGIWVLFIRRHVDTPLWMRTFGQVPAQYRGNHCQFSPMSFDASDIQKFCCTSHWWQARVAPQWGGSSTLPSTFRLPALSNSNIEFFESESTNSKPFTLENFSSWMVISVRISCRRLPYTTSSDINAKAVDWIETSEWLDVLSFFECRQRLLGYWSQCEDMRTLMPLMNQRRRVIRGHANDYPQLAGLHLGAAPASFLHTYK
ncbi:hypothetical protein BDZ45DRAFT_250814 [Acephala macrosclerotiorum]|nr:hypothetical protein BDZ45DRAFT_250814 [Acephala macrosclerotiorum]